MILYLVSRHSLGFSRRSHHKMNIRHQLVVEHDCVSAEDKWTRPLHPEPSMQHHVLSKVGITEQCTRERVIHLSLMEGYKPCQLHPWMVLLLLMFCCWYCWTAVGATVGSFLAGNSSAAILPTRQLLRGGFHDRGSGNLWNKTLQITRMKQKAFIIYKINTNAWNYSFYTFTSTVFRV